MGLTGKTAFGPYGFSTGEVDITLTNSTGGALVEGDIVQLDTGLTVAATLRYGAVDSGYATGITPASISKQTVFFAVALGDVADGATGQFRIWGKAKVKMNDTSGVPALVAVEDEGRVTTGGLGDINSAATGRVVCRAEAAGTGTAGTAEVVDAFFIGVPALS